MRKSPRSKTRRESAGRTDWRMLAAITAAIGLGFFLPASHVRANGESTETSSLVSSKSSKSFKGKLPITELSEDEAILHALNRLAYGPRPGDIENVRKMGLEKWIDQQLHPESIDDSALDARLEQYPTLRMSSKKLLDEFPPPQQAAKKEGVTKEAYQEQMKEKSREAVAQAQTTGPNAQAAAQLAKIQGPQRIVAELSMAKLDRAIYSHRQLEAVMEDFWYNHFNVFVQKDSDKWLVTAYVRDTIRPHTLGKFQDLLVDTARSPAMLIYLDNWLSVDPIAYQRQQAEAAMRRQRFQGVFAGVEMPQPGTFPPPYNNPNAPPRVPPKKQDKGLNENYGREVMELHTLGVDGGYTQQDVIQMARCLTGWTVHEPRRDPEFFFDVKLHTEGKKVVLGHTFNYGGMKDGEDALKMLANNPNAAKFISTKLARHFVSDNPPPALVDRMAHSYLSSGGDIRVLMKTMIYSREFWSREAFRAKVKEPFELAASTARALNADAEITLPLVQWVGRMGEPLFQAQPPTGYSDKAEMWVNTGALLNRLNFALSLSSNKISGTSVNLESMLGPDAGSDPQVALSTAINLFLDGQIAPLTRQTLEGRMDDPQIVQAKLDDPVKHVNQALVAGLVLGAPEFQRR
ncbi:MAG TPA: DUF1800 domain-containing protein [Candidatus Acidoferrales bacterium]